MEHTVPYQTPWDSWALLPEIPGLLYPCLIKSPLYTTFSRLLVHVQFSSKVANLRCCIQHLSIYLPGAPQIWLLPLPCCCGSLFLRTLLVFGCGKAPHFLSVFLADSRLEILLPLLHPLISTLYLSAFHPLQPGSPATVSVGFLIFCL